MNGFLEIYILIHIPINIVSVSDDLYNMYDISMNTNWLESS